MSQQDRIIYLADIPRVQAGLRGADVAVRFEDRGTTFAELDARSNQVAAALIALGAGAGARLAVLSKSHDHWYQLMFGAAKARACLTPINARLAPPEIAYILQDAAPAVLFVGADFLELAQSVAATLAAPPVLVALYGQRAGYADFEVWRDAAPPLATPPTPRDDDDVLQLYTSGTTGRPKGVVLSNHNYRAFLGQVSQVDGFSYAPGEAVMITMPLFHVAGTNVSFSALSQGSSVVLVADFNPAAAMTMMANDGIAHVFLAPAMILMMLMTPGADALKFPHLRTIAYGSAPISEDVLKRAQATFGCGFVQFYGMTESVGAGTYLSPAAHALPGKLTSCGRAWPGMEVRVVDADGAPTPDGVIGEIVFKGDMVMKQYWGNPQATTEAVVDGWLHTGDAGLRDADGYFYIHDRMKDMIVTGGENVYPAEVENAIHGCPGVADVAVISVPSERWGEEVKAIIVPTPGMPPPTEEAVIAWARVRIAGFKAPKSIAFIDALPRNASGKILRRELRAPYWAGRERAVG